MKVCSICQRCYEDTAVSCVETEHPELSKKRTGGPDMIAGYQLELLLGSGLKGEVYRALRTDSQLSCLIKIVASNEENKQKFLQDAKTATTLFNQSIVDVYECGSLESGEVFVVAEEAAGQTVRELLNNVGVPQLLTTVQIVRQTAEAVHALHLSGLTHRAIRPENIILTTDAEHRLLVRIQNADLGGVAEHSIVSNKFLIDSALDSIRYFAPEQFSGEGASVKSDVYSLGIVFYEMLAGTPPFDAEKASGLIDLHRNQRPPDVTIDNFDLRMLLTHTLMESLQKQAGKRQSSANAFARQLRHVEQLATHSPTPPAAGTVAAPPLANFAVASVSAAPRPVAAVEPSKMQPVIVRVENAPVVPKVAPDVIELKAEPEPLPISEIEIISDIELQCVDKELPVIPQRLDEEPIAANGKMESGPPKSRLKRLKKQLRSFTTPGAEASTTPVVETGLEGSSVAPEGVPVVTSVLAAVVTSQTARKIVSEQPEDDLPSLDDIPAALFSEPMPATPVVLESQATAPPPAVSNVPRKIEWEQPEDDIPYIEETRVFASEQRLHEVSIEPVATESVMAAAVSKAPRKIEWVQPEDDIPSLEETLDVVSRESISVAAVIEPVPSVAESAPAPAAPRKIEWVPPDDDIPSMEDVVKILATGQKVESTLDPVHKEMPTGSPVIVPKKIEWVQPEDDIPTIEDLVLANEQTPESAFASSTFEEEVAATSLIAPKKIDWVQPDDDIPSMEDVMEVLATEQVVESALLQPPENSEPATSIAAKKIEWVQPDDDVPSIEAAMEVLAVEQTVVSAFVEPMTEEDIPSMEEPREILPKMPAADPQTVHAKQDEIAVESSYIEAVPEVINVMPVVRAEPEEITLVSPPRRIKIDWEQPKPWEALSKEIEFFPTLLGDVDTNRKTDTQSEPFFSDYYTDEEARSSDHYRSLMIGSGFIALIVLFLFGNDSVWNYLQNGSPADSVAVKTTSSTQSFPQSGQTTTPNDQRVLKSFEKPKFDDDVESGQSKPSALKVSTSSPDETSPVEKMPEPNKGPQKPATGRSVGKTPLVPSTLVISLDDGKISSKVEPQSKRSANKKPSSSVSIESTRPRIVENPQP